MEALAHDPMERRIPKEDEPDEDNLAEIGTRIAAFVIDLGVLLGLVALFVVLTLVLPYIPVLEGILSKVSALAVSGAGTAYVLFKDGLYGGRSAGKKIMDLQVVTESGDGAGFAESVKRNFLLPIVFMPIVELIMLLTNEDRQRLGDQIAATRVIVSPDDHGWGDYMGKK